MKIRQYTIITSGDEHQFHNVLEFSNFKYLGTVLIEQHDSKEEINARLTPGNRCYFTFLWILRPKTIIRLSKLKMYKTILKLVVMVQKYEL